MKIILWEKSNINGQKQKMS